MLPIYASSRVTFGGHRNLQPRQLLQYLSRGGQDILEISENQFRVPLQTREGLASCRRNAVSASHSTRLEFHVSRKTCAGLASYKKTPCIASHLTRLELHVFHKTCLGLASYFKTPCPRHTRRGGSFTSLTKRARVWRPTKKRRVFASHLTRLEFHVSHKTCSGLASY